MKAFEARRKVMEDQYGKVMEEIEEAVSKEYINVLVYCDKILYPDVIERLLKEGYDVTNIVRTVKVDYVVSWEQAEEGKEGTISWVKKNEPEEPSDEKTFSEFLLAIWEDSSLNEKLK